MKKSIKSNNKSLFNKKLIKTSVLRMTVLFFWLFMALDCYAATYYVSTSGDDTNIGTIEEPWRTVEESVDKLQPGDTFYLREGIYFESNIDIDISGEESNWITIRNYPGEDPVVDGGYLDFRTVPNNDWEVFDAGKNIYRSVYNYPGADSVHAYLDLDCGTFYTPYVKKFKIVVISIG